MKKFILMILLISAVSFAQTRKVGDLSTPYSTTGWDAPVSLTPFYQFYIYELMSNPGGWINKQTLRIDSLFNALVVYTDTLQLEIINDTLRISRYASGFDSFDTTAETDTVLIPGIDSLDVLTVNIIDDIPSANDRLSVKLIDNKAVIQRPASGTSGLKYSWRWTRRY